LLVTGDPYRGHVRAGVALAEEMARAEAQRRRLEPHASHLPRELRDELAELERAIAIHAYDEGHADLARLLASHERASEVAELLVEPLSAARRSRRVYAVVIVAVLLGALGLTTSDSSAGCRERGACDSSGLCSPGPHGSCVATSDADCRASNECGSHGRCSLVQSRCAALSDYDCWRTRQCIKSGHCTLVRGECRPGDESDCKSSEACLDHDLCRYDPGPESWGRCLPVSDAGCEKTVDCQRNGMCSYREGGCVPTSTDHCTRSIGCRVSGRCALVGTRCVAAHEADCRASRECDDLGACRLDGNECVNPSAVWE
jgi:hypothetical protein